MQAGMGFPRMATRDSVQSAMPRSAAAVGANDVNGSCAFFADAADPKFLLAKREPPPRPGGLSWSGLGVPAGSA
jgi:hypothetical protein